MKNTTVVSTSILLTSLLGYWYARQKGRDSVPYVMLGGFLGSIIGERIAASLNRKQDEQVARQ